jgi:hypothetical protein
MYRFLMLAGAALNLFCALAHCAFWQRFNWAVELAKLEPVNHGTVEVLNFAVIYLIFWIAAVSLYFAWARPRGAWVQGVMWFVAGFYMVRAVDEFPCYGDNGGGWGLIGLCLALAACYLGALPYTCNGVIRNADSKRA